MFEARKQKNIFLRDEDVSSAYSGVIWDNIRKQFYSPYASKNPGPEWRELKRGNREFEMRGPNHLTRTRWWLHQGDYFIPQVKYKLSFIQRRNSWVTKHYKLILILLPGFLVFDADFDLGGDEF